MKISELLRSINEADAKGTPVNTPVKAMIAYKKEDQQLFKTMVFNNLKDAEKYADNLNGYVYKHKPADAADMSKGNNNVSRST